MSEHTPTLWYSAGWDRDKDAVEIRGFGAAILHGLYLGGTDQAHINANRAVACVNAFHSPDGRKIATEDISEGLVWQMYDVVAAVMEYADDEIDDPFLALEALSDIRIAARALLSSLKVQGPET